MPDRPVHDQNRDFARGVRFNFISAFLNVSKVRKSYDQYLK